MPGRPRDPDLEHRLLDAAWSLLKNGGYDALTLTQVAAHANAHRSDVYRRWSSKAQLVVDVLTVHLPPVADRNTGALDSDLRSIVAGFAASWSAPWIDGLLGMTADLQRDPNAELAWRRMAEGRGSPIRNAIARATKRGEIGEVHNPSLIGDLVEGPLMHRRMIGRQPLTPDFLDAVAAVAYQACLGMTVQR